MTEIDQNLKLAFSKVKQDISELNNEIASLKGGLINQSNLNHKLINQLEELFKEFKELKESVSIGNDRVNQSINHLINQSITNQSFNHEIEEISPKMPPNPQSIGKGEANQSFNQSITNQSFNHLINQVQEEPLKEVATNLNNVFLSFSKQELKLFLTVYQLEDDGNEASYKTISTKMQLSEHCIRSHLSSLLRKNAPIIKNRLNNHTNLLSISREFRSLNLKQRIISMYYEADPHQKTLFDV